MSEETQHIFTVSEVTEAVKSALEGRFGIISVQGEISNLSTPGSGHIYFSLKDDINQIKVAMFRYGSNAEKTELEDGQKVTVTGRLTAYGKAGYYQIIAREIQIVGIGELLVQFEKLKKKLEKNGLFKPEHKRKIPQFPSKIGIITSPTGAAIRDILKIIRHRYCNVDILIYPVPVQGKEAPEKISTAIREMNEFGGIDVLIVGRGGGSIEDLWAFNDEGVAWAIYDSKIPVISAVGHEVDFTISDFVADLRASTPSNAAELVVPDAKAIESGLLDDSARAGQALDNMVRQYEQKLSGYLAGYAFRVPFELFEDYSQRVDDASTDIDKALAEKIKFYEERIGLFYEKTALLNPTNILKKGYSIVYDESTENILNNAQDAGQRIKVRFYKGELTAEVKNKKN